MRKLRSGSRTRSRARALAGEALRVEAVYELSVSLSLRCELYVDDRSERDDFEEREDLDDLDEREDASEITDRAGAGFETAIGSESGIEVTVVFSLGSCSGSDLGSGFGSVIFNSGSVLDSNLCSTIGAGRASGIGARAGTFKSVLRDLSVSDLAIDGGGAGICIS